MYLICSTKSARVQQSPDWDALWRTQNNVVVCAVYSAFGLCVQVARSAAAAVLSLNPPGVRHNVVGQPYHG